MLSSAFFSEVILYKVAQGHQDGGVELVGTKSSGVSTAQGEEDDRVVGAVSLECVGGREGATRSEAAPLPMSLGSRSKWRSKTHSRTHEVALFLWIAIGVTIDVRRTRRSGSVRLGPKWPK